MPLKTWTFLISRNYPSSSIDHFGLSPFVFAVTGGHHRIVGGRRKHLFWQIFPLGQCTTIKQGFSVSMCKWYKIFFCSALSKSTFFTAILLPVILSNSFWLPSWKRSEQHALHVCVSVSEYCEWSQCKACALFCHDCLIHMNLLEASKICALPDIYSNILGCWRRTRRKVLFKHVRPFWPLGPWRQKKGATTSFL